MSSDIPNWINERNQGTSVVSNFGYVMTQLCIMNLMIVMIQVNAIVINKLRQKITCLHNSQKLVQFTM